MSTLAERSGRALLVIDVQNDVVEQAYDRDAVVARISTLVDGARTGGVPVVWIQHNDEYLAPGSDPWQIVGALTPGEGEPRIDKQYRSSFESTSLEDALAALGVDELVLCGAETNNCVRHTMHAALERGYDVTLVSDAHTTWHGTWGDVTVDGAPIIAEQNRNAGDYRLPGRRSATQTTAEVLTSFSGG